MVTLHVGQHLLDRELDFQGILSLPAVFQEFVEMPLLSNDGL